MENSLKTQIIELRKNGNSVNDIAKIIGCAKATISYHINKEGLGGARYDLLLKDINDETINKIKKYKSELKSYSEIKKLLNITEDKLKKICRIYNINKPTKCFEKKKLDPIEIINYYTEVKSLRKTASYFKSDRSTVRQHIPDEIISLNIQSIHKNKKSKSYAVTSWRKRAKLILVEYKGGKCERCGYSKCIHALHFHHLNPEEKDFQISGKSYSIERLKKEVDKCIMVCANCHIEIHEELKNNNLLIIK